MEFDFSGYATKAGLKCRDGKTIMSGAFKDQDKAKVPLVWQHGHNDPENVLGHVILENRDDGVYAYGFLNDTNKADHARKLLTHGDINKMSIWANDLIEKAGRVHHGTIREVSLVLAGANPGAVIDNITIAHSDGTEWDVEDEAIIYTGIPINGPGEIISHEDSDEDEDEEDDEGDGERTIEDVFNTMNEEQKQAVAFLVAVAAGEEDDEDSEDDEDNEDEEEEKTIQQDGLNSQGETDMGKRKNVFEKDETNKSDTVLSHDALNEIIADATKSANGSLKEAFEEYALAHGIENIGTLFPEPKDLNMPPEWITRDMGWVSKLMGKVNRRPFSRIKTRTADLTYDTARAKGYIKGTMKKEQFFDTAYRTTSPTTVYKKQQLDRDDMVDITDFDVVAWLRQEMRFMLEEEIARAILTGDGRDVEDPDKINEGNIRPVMKDADFYVTTMKVDTSTNAQEIVDQLIRSRPHYRGTGTPVMFTTEKWIAEMLLLRDDLGRRIYRSLDEIASEARVSEIIPVEVLEEVRDSSGKEIVAIIFNPVDYGVGADRGGEVNMFDDFDIDYNQHKYLIETRISGALTKPKSAIVLVSDTSSTIIVNAPVIWDSEAYTLFLPNVRGVSYTDGDGGDVLRPGLHQVGDGTDDAIDLKIVVADGYTLSDSGDGEAVYEGPNYNPD